MKTKTKAKAAAKKQPVKAAEAVSAPKVADYERKRTEIEVAKLKVAPWNPRPKITPESVADLAASIESLGVIEPLVAMMDADGCATLLSGHRRLAAAKVAKLDKVPCDILVGIDEQTAKRMTFIANLQRKDADPLLESELVGSLVQSGMTQDEIAAETGRGRQWVARRANLANLSPSWRKRVKDGEEITIDCLEHVAAYPEEIQEKCKDAQGGYYGANTDMLTWSGVRWQFDRETRDLRDVLFDTAKCKTCPNNSGCCQDLFDDTASKDNLGKCLDAKCFERMTEAAVCDAVAKAKSKGREVVKNKQPYQVGVYGATKKPTKTNTALYVYTDCNGRKTMEYAAPPPPNAEKPAKTKEERQAKREAAKRQEFIDNARDEACGKFGEWIDEREKNGDWPQWFIDVAVHFLCEEVRDGYSVTCDNAVDAFARNTGFKASDVEADKVYQEYLAEAYKEADDE